MNGKNVAPMTLARSLMIGHRNAVLRFLVNNVDAYEQLSEAIRHPEVLERFLHLADLHAEVTAILQSNAALAAIEAMLDEK